MNIFKKLFGSQTTLLLLKAVAYYERISFYFGIIIGGLPGRLVRLGGFLLLNT